MKSISMIATAMVVTCATSAGAEQMQITTEAERASSRGAAEYFSGDVTVKPLYPANDHTSNSGGLVEFSPRARSAWHTHRRDRRSSLLPAQVGFRRKAARSA